MIPDLSFSGKMLFFAQLSFEPFGFFVSCVSLERKHFLDCTCLSCISPSLFTLEFLARNNVELRAGDVVLCGAIGAVVPDAEPGVYEAASPNGALPPVVMTLR